MCGINGYVAKQGHRIANENTLRSMNERIYHRGPDSEGVFVKDLGLSVVGMGMRRLSIIDIGGGAQPMFSDDKSLAIVFNGEIFNFHEIKHQLEQEHHIKFSTQSDTEVVLKGYGVWGIELLQKLNGMFAFSIFDEKKNEIFIARDRLGEKPLYYSLDESSFVWSSELKSIVAVCPEKKKISQNAFNLYFSLSYIPAPYSIYDNVFKLPAGHYLRLNINTFNLSISRYWDVPTDKESSVKSYNQAKKELRNLLFDATEKRMIADVPLGTFLSGGVDSSIVSAIMAKISKQPIQTFSIGYRNKRYDESERARMVARHIGSEHHEYILNYDEILGDVDRIILNYDEPYADSSCLPTYFVSKCASTEVKVALTGDGGDEVFGGYNKYLSIRYRQLFNRYLPPFIQQWITSDSFREKYLVKGDTRSFASKLRKLLSAVEKNPVNAHLNIISLGFNQNEIAALFHNAPISTYDLLLANIDKNTLDSLHDELKLVRYLDKEISLEGDMLVKVDRASMLCSLECRSPYLDHRLMEFSYTVPDNFLLNGSNKKRILKDTFADMLPANFFNAPKSGFEIPIGEWFRTVLSNDLKKTLCADNLDKHNLLNVHFVQNLIQEHLSQKADHATKLWVLYCFQKWFHKQ
ncbi:asparagine synthetase B [Bacteroidia bacterium]|nr:asparagine synthetase B [Bacteroidia bacterium]